MDKVARMIEIYWFPLTLGFLITAAALQIMVEVRGYFAIGGEHLITPILCMVHYTLREAVKAQKRRKRHVRRNKGTAYKRGLQNVG